MSAGLRHRGQWRCRRRVEPALGRAAQVVGSAQLSQAVDLHEDRPPFDGVAVASRCRFRRPLSRGRTVPKRPATRHTPPEPPRPDAARPARWAWRSPRACGPAQGRPGRGCRVVWLAARTGAGGRVVPCHAAPAAPARHSVDERVDPPVPFPVAWRRLRDVATRWRRAGRCPVRWSPARAVPAQGAAVRRAVQCASAPAPRPRAGHGR